MFLRPDGRPAEPVEPFESLENRRLLSADVNVAAKKFSQAVEGRAIVLPVAVPIGNAGLDANAELIDRAWGHVSDLSQYDDATLAGTPQWVVRSDDNARLLARQLGAKVEPSGILGDAYYVTFTDPTVAVGRLSDAAGVSTFYPSVPLAREARLVPNDSLFPQEWHLRNTGQGGGTVGLDANVVPAWDTTLGEGVVIGIVDDGVQYTHPDLSPNYDTTLDRDFNDNDNSPLPGSDDDNHGTPVAGIAAARGGNGIGVSGAAPRATLTGLRLISQYEPDSVEAQALTWKSDDIDIYNNSWGPDDGATYLDGPGPLTTAALLDTATHGRDGLGSILVWAGGNGAQNYDNSNFDGYANNRNTIAVGALNNFGTQSYYSERGANLLVVAPSSGGSRDIYTTAIGSSYIANFGGTSAASPLVAGVVALMLSANPNLTYRDVEHILVQTAETVDPGNSSWQINGAGNTVSDVYGHGNIDAAAAVSLAQNWTNVAPEQSWTTGNLVVNRTIPDNNAGGITAQVQIDAGLNVEQVEVYFDATHSFTGDLELTLISPDGTESVLHRPSIDGTDYTDWTYTTTMDWGEDSDGVWQLRVRDLASQDIGTFQRWGLHFFGTTADNTAPQLVAENFDRADAAALRFTFDEPVSAETYVLEVLNLTSGDTLDANDFLLDVDGDTVTATYAPGGVVKPMPNGNYSATLSGITDTAGNAAGAQNLTFSYLNGDVDNDRDVDLFDAAVVERNFGRINNPPYSQGDLDYDGDVDRFDSAILERNFGTTLPPVSPAIVTTPRNSRVGRAFAGGELGSLFSSGRKRGDRLLSELR